MALPLEIPAPWRRKRPMSPGVLCACVSILSSVAVSSIAPADTRQWSVHEITLAAAGSYDKPYTSVEVAARFTGPDGTETAVRGFWDGGRTFKVRFTPTCQGRWRFAVESAPEDEGLTRAGEFEAAAPLPGHHGFWRRDARYPTRFVFEDGTREYIWGTTYYGLVSNARAGGGWQQSITNIVRYGIRKARFLLAPGSADKPSYYPASNPFLDGNADQLDLAHWEATDRVIGFLADHGVLADVIVFPYRRSADEVASLAQDERFLRYAVARLGAFPNVTWCLVNEWNYSVLSRDYWNQMGHRLRREDPWAIAGALADPARRGSPPSIMPRALSIHQQTRPDWNFAEENWHSHAILQFGVRNRGPSARVGDEWAGAGKAGQRFRHGDEWGNHSIVRNWTGAYPVVNDEYGYIGEPQDDSEGRQPDGSYKRFTRLKHRNTCWGIAVAGGYGAAGDKNDYEDGRPYKSANWHDTPEYGDIQRLVDFFSQPGLDYWKMGPDNALIKSGARVYALAERGAAYVFYAAAGGSFSAALAPGQYRAWRFDPRTGEAATLPDVAGGETRSISLPDDQDWVIHLEARRGSE